MLSSWQDGAAKAAIVDFVERITASGGRDFVPPAERIAVFDNDGTLWCEQPVQVQVFFLADRIRQLAAKDESIAARQPFKAFIEHDTATLHALGKKGLLELFASTHAGMTQDEFDALARAWFAQAKHPKLGRLFKENTYRPQVELVRLLRERGFSTYIVSGGGIDLIRAFSAEAYGIPPECVIGSSFALRFETRPGGPAVLVKTADLETFDDREAKPQNIGLRIGRRPILAFGNSDGDLAMLRYTKSGPGPRLALLLHHDDAQREFAYDRDFKLSPLAEGLDKAQEYGIHVVGMKNDWKAVFG